MSDAVAQDARKFQYIIEIDPSKTIRDGGQRAVLSILGEKRYPTTLEASEDHDWWYRPGRELDADTIGELEAVPGVKVRKWNF